MNKERSLNVMFKSDRQDWATPDNFIEWLNDEMCLRFDLDAAASDDNHKAPSYFTVDDDGLNCDWWGRVWLNPPFGRELPLWLEKCVQEIRREQVESIHVLIPARTDTKWFHEIVVPNAYAIYLIKGRFNFRFDRAIEGANAPFPSMLVHFKSDWCGPDGSAALMTLEVPKIARGFDGQ